MPGVRDVVQVPSGVAVIADHFWAAKLGRDALTVDWDAGPGAALDSERMRDEFRRLADTPGTVAATGGDARAALGRAQKTVDSEYTVPYLAHAPMEPLNCTVRIEGGRCEIWTGTQFQTIDQQVAAGITGLKPESIEIHTQFLGGGFGRRATPTSDFVSEAVHVAKAAGRPVKIVWTREDDVRGGYYRPAYVQRLRVGLDYNAFVMESVIDELAAAAGRDPVEYRRALLAKHPRHLGVLNLAAEKAGWDTPVPAGRARGVAVHESFGSYLAQVAEVSVADGRIRVHRVVCAIDCGIAVNPAGITAQVEGAIAFGLGAALFSRLDIREGRTQQSNFHDYRVLRIDEMPAVEVHFVPSREKPGGVGEPGVPPIAPSVANAIFALTGQRLRALPLQLKA